MNESELAIHKEKIKKVMVDHLTTLGWPNLPNEKVIGELKNMWVKIEEANLKLPGMDFKAFAAHANNELVMSQVKDILGI